MKVGAPRRHDGPRHRLAPFARLYARQRAVGTCLLPASPLPLGCAGGGLEFPLLAPSGSNSASGFLSCNPLRRLFASLQVLPCSKRFVHDWTECPFAHPQEKARRRDPRLHNYTGIACPSMKKVGPVWCTEGRTKQGGQMQGAKGGAFPAAGARPQYRLARQLLRCCPFQHPFVWGPPKRLLGFRITASTVDCTAELEGAGAGLPCHKLSTPCSQSKPPLARRFAGGLLRVWRPLPIRSQRV
jgi:hypothetical protein